MNDTVNKTATTIMRSVFCFLLPVGVFVLTAAIEGVYPFGDASFLTEDLKYQYIDYFAWLRSVLAGETSLFYSFAQALGGNTWGMVSYYLSSPFNLLILFFDESHLTDFVFLITALKLGCIQLSAMWYLRRRFSLPWIVSCVLALGFTCSTWTMTQLRNPMWMDALIILPFVAQGTFDFIRNGKWKLFTLSIFAAIVTCWYMAYMLVLFSCLYAVFEWLIYRFEGARFGVKANVRLIAGFCGALLLALGLSLFTFAPAVLAMLGGDGAAPANYLRHVYLSTFVGDFFFGSWVTDKSAQMFFGIVPVVLAATFFVTPNVSRRVKMAVALFLLFMCASIALVPLETIWCGLRAPNGFYSRISFLFGFMLLWVAGYVVTLMRDGLVERRAVLAGTAILLVVVTLCAFASGFPKVEQAVLSAVLIVVYAALICLALSPCFADIERKWRVVLSGVAIAFVFCELLANSCIMWGHLYGDYSQSWYESYIERESKIANALEESDDSVYRVEQTFRRAGAAVNDGYPTGLMQLASYCSARDENAVAFLNELGYSDEGQIATNYRFPILVSDSLLGVKYVLSENRPNGLEESDVEDSSDEVSVFENPFAMSIGYGASALALNANLSAEDNVFERQNRFASAVLGREVELFTELDSSCVALSSGGYQWLATVPAGCLPYVYVQEGDGKLVNLTVGDSSYAAENFKWRHSVIPAADVSTENTALSVIAVGTDDPADQLMGDETCLLYGLDMAALREVIDELSVDQFEPTVFEDGRVEGSFTATRDGEYLLMSIPNDAGWTVKVNGQVVETQNAFDGALMLIPVNAGENEITMTYATPGLLLGCIASAVSLLLFGVLCIHDARISRAPGVSRKTNGEFS